MLCISKGDLCIGKLGALREDCREHRKDEAAQACCVGHHLFIGMKAPGLTASRLKSSGVITQVCSQSFLSDVKF